MDFPQNMSMEEAFALAEAEAKLNAALQESEERFSKAKMPDRLNEDWRFGRPHKYAKELAARIKGNENIFETISVSDAGEAAVRLTSEDEDLRQTEMLMPTIGSDALLGMHLDRFGDGYALYIEESTKKPIRLNYVTRCECSPSTFIMVAPGVRAEVSVSYGCLECGSIFATCNIQVAEGAELNVRVSAAGDGADGRCMLITNIQNMGGKVAHLTSYQGLRWAREETVAEIYAPGSETKLFSANNLDNGAILDQHTKQIHHVGGATSDLLYKNVLDGNATATFSGNIYVAPGAHNTDAYQSNRNLMLSEDATVNSLPGLEILADKVRCSHGSASGPMDEEQLFYLLSRGIPEYEAHRLIAAGFLQEAVEKSGMASDFITEE